MTWRNLMLHFNNSFKRGPDHGIGFCTPYYLSPLHNSICRAVFSTLFFAVLIQFALCIEIPSIPLTHSQNLTKLLKQSFTYWPIRPLLFTCTCHPAWHLWIYYMFPVICPSLLWYTECTKGCSHLTWATKGGGMDGKCWLFLIRGCGGSLIPD